MVSTLTCMSRLRLVWSGGKLNTSLKTKKQNCLISTIHIKMKMTDGMMSCPGPSTGRRPVVSRHKLPNHQAILFELGRKRNDGMSSLFASLQGQQCSYK